MISTIKSQHLEIMQKKSVVSCQLPLQMAEIAVENERISIFEELVTLALNRIICIPSTYMPISLKSKNFLCVRGMYVQTDRHWTPNLLRRPKN